MIWKVSRRFGKFLDDLKSVQIIKKMYLDYKKTCKTTCYAHLLRIWKLAQFTRFIWKVFVTKILLSGKFLLFVTLGEVPCLSTLQIRTFSSRQCLFLPTAKNFTLHSDCKYQGLMVKTWSKELKLFSSILFLIMYNPLVSATLNKFPIIE